MQQSKFDAASQTEQVASTLRLVLVSDRCLLQLTDSDSLGKFADVQCSSSLEKWVTQFSRSLTAWICRLI